MRAGDARVAAGGRRGVRAVPGAVTWRQVFQTRIQRVGVRTAGAGVGPGDPGVAVIPRADQLVAAHRRREALACDASSLPFGRRRAVGRGHARAAVSHWVAQRIGLVAERGVLRPDAGVDDTDDDVLTLDLARSRVKLRPQPTGCGQSQKAGRAGGVGLDQGGLDHRRHAGGLLQRLRLRIGQQRREAVVAIAVVVQCGRRHARLGKLGTAAHRQVVGVGAHVGRRAVELGAAGWSGGCDAADAAGISGCGRIGQLDDVDLLGGDLGVCAQAQDQQPCRQCNTVVCHRGFLVGGAINGRCDDGWPPGPAGSKPPAPGCQARARS